MERDFSYIQCAVCNKAGEFKVLYPEHLSNSKPNFTARKLPDRMHFRIVKCKKCGLIYSNPIYRTDTFEKLYRGSPFIQEEQILNQLKVYGHHLMGINIPTKENFLEIGCGNGAFLKEAKRLGYKNVFGVEPCTKAVEVAYPGIKDRIINDFFQKDLFEEDFFNVVCCFRTIDHMLYPNDLLRDVHKILKRDGIFLVISHDMKAFWPWILGEHSPMIDIGHIYLFDKDTIRRLFENNKYEVIYLESVKDIYSAEYFLKMTPLPSFLRKILLALVSRLNLSKKSINFYGGNFACAARKI